MKKTSFPPGTVKVLALLFLLLLAGGTNAQTKKELRKARREARKERRLEKQVAAFNAEYGHIITEKRLLPDITVFFFNGDDGHQFYYVTDRKKGVPLLHAPGCGTCHKERIAHQTRPPYKPQY